MLAVEGTVRFSHHAVERYRERVRPALDVDGAFRELLSLVSAAAEVVSEPPQWCPWGSAACGYLVIGDVVFPLIARPGVHVATTCLTKGAYGSRRSRVTRSIG